MKKTTIKILFIMFFVTAYTGMAQTLNQNAAWPNGAWSVTGTYNADPTAFEANPTVDANFAFDDDDAGNGSDDDIAAESPVIDLTAAHGAGETWISISGNLVYNYNNDDILQFEYWDADGATWNIIGVPIDADTAGAPTDNFCTGTSEAYTSAILNIAGFTATQLSGFRYRIYFDDLVGGAGYEWGFCFDAPTITSATPPTCPDPVALTATNIDGFSADLGWSETGSATLWNIELVDITGGGTVTGTATASGVTNPYNQSGLDPSTNYEFYVQSDCGVNGTSTWVGPLAFSTTVACPDPSALNAINITTTTADLGWTAGGSETLWDVEIVDITAAGTATGTPTASGVANPYMATGLSDANSYEFYVRADCAANGTSAWVGPFAFTTACNTFTAPYTEAFENAGALPNCWALGGDEDWRFSNTGAGNHIGNNGTITGTSDSGGYFAWVDDSTPDAANAQLDSPFVDLSGLTTPALSFYELSNNEGQPSATLTVSVWDGAAWNVVGTYNTNTPGWEQKVIDLSGLTFTGPAQARFAITDSGSFYDDIAIDDVSFDELPSCLDPSALTATNIDGFSADLGWTENGTATLWNIELVDITGGGTVTGTPTASGVTNPYNQSGLDPSTNYEFYVQADCGVNGTSAWAGPFAFSTTVACPAPSALTATNIMTTTADLGWTAGASETLWDVEIVDITAAGTATGTPTATGVANPYMATGLTDSNNYEFYVRADCAANGISAWAGPFAFTTACTTFTAPYTETFENGGAVPACWTLGGDENWLFANTGAGNHIGNNGTITGSSTSGGYFAWVDDSTPDAANAQMDSPFVDVSGLTVPALSFYELSNNEGQPNATLTVSVWDGAAWNVVGTYNTNTTGWEQKVIDLSGLTFTGPAQVRFSIADSTSFYDDIAIDDVTLDELPTCVDPSTLTATSITNAAADLGWTENGTATLWNIELVDVTASGTPTGTPTASGVTNPYAATGLAQNNNYAFYVQSDCGPGGLSSWVGPFNFTTLETCPAPSGLSATSVMETSADLGWAENGTSTSWNIELVDVTAGGTQTMTATASGVTNPYNQTGLVGDNTYQFYVQADCGVDGVSAWAGPFTFATPYVAVPPSCTNDTFLDSGGQSGDYSSSENITYTICPDVAGNVVTVSFTSFSTENNGAAACYDGLTIHDGADNTATTIDPVGGGTIWCWDEDDTPAVGTGDLEGMMITSSDASGCLTFVFTSDGSVTREGWKADIGCVLSVESAEARGFLHYVNTVDNSFNVNAQSNIASIEVYNLIGQIITTAKPNDPSGAAYLGSAKNGVYFAKVTLENGRTSVVKFVK
ncbi:hypothetical protein IMCC3317_01380 [Kordia antarctica]|uniref:T9SS type A sorting domain-containing protein n=1 Tax=Kordia antarctica TaxID=1218801 RepID=A0A7L4ZFQ7_9FLAO|nr:fibronectin type III domain-containing protein [Kordia antarctica]QHI34794.1 hypothetical protein IMCC3317_01380 [Kordia antarctica]